MTTPAAGRDPRRGRPHRAVVRLGLVVVCLGLVLATVLLRSSRPAPTTTDLAHVEAAAVEGCPLPAAHGDPGGFALDGVVHEVVPAAGGGPTQLRLEVREWFRGPPVDRVEVALPATAVRRLDDVGPGTRLLVSGRGWGQGRQVLDADVCGGTLPHGADTAAAWRTLWRDPRRPSPSGPVARYLAAGFVRGGPGDPPALTGVLLTERGCVYVDDGLTRWVPVFPDASSGWVASPPQVRFAGGLVDVGHQVRLPGVPASGAGPREGPPLEDEGARSRLVDGTGVPGGCDPDRPRFVVAEPPLGPTPPARSLGPGDGLLVVTRVAAEAAGLEPASVTGQARLDLFGAHQYRLALRSRSLGPVLVHVETVAVGAWPRAYAASDARLRWSGDPDQGADLPEPPHGAQLAVVERGDGQTQVLLRTGDRVVVSVTADLRGSATGQAEGQVRALADLAGRVALSRAGVGS